MTSFSTLHSKIEALGRLVSKDSISPTYLSSLLDEMVDQMESIDMSGMSAEISAAVANAKEALQKASTAVSTASSADSTAKAAQQLALSAVEKANNAVTKATEANNTAAAANQTAYEAKAMASNAQGNANIANQTAESALELANKHERAIGTTGGIAPLDESGKVPSSYLPSYLDDVVEFEGTLTLAPQLQMASGVAGGTILYCVATNSFVYCVGSLSLGGLKFYPNWAEADAYGTASVDGRVPVSGKIYLDISTNKQYRWSGSTLVTTGSDLALGETEQTAYSGAKGKKLREDVDLMSLNLDGIKILPFNGTFNPGNGRIPPVVGVWWSGGAFLFRDSSFGYTSEDYNVTNEDGSLSGRTDCLFRRENNLYRVVDGDLKELGGTAVGNDYNVTVDQPVAGYYDLPTAIQATYAKKLAAEGLNITFAIAKGSWKTYKYVGSGVDENFLVVANWIDTAGQSAGTEPLININFLCGNPTAAEFYSFEAAIEALVKLESESKVTYRKRGMVITYLVASGKWETLQLVQGTTNAELGNRDAWKEFGGGSEIVAKDDPADGGTDAFSTAGAYNYLPVQHLVTQEDGKVTIELQNAAGNPVMEPIEFLASSGGGGSVSGTIVTVKFEQAALYGALGATIAANVAIRSVTMSGNTEVDNAIESLELIDRDTNVTVWSQTVNKASSADMEDYSFSIDFTSFMSQAGKRRFTLRATDETGVSGSKNITVTAEDLTASVSGVQVLNAREDALIKPTDERVSVDMFAFSNNQSDKGIEALVEILINGKWQQLHKSTVTDTFTKSVSFSPKSLGLNHGAYPVRIQGTSLNSGVKGNVVYSAIFVIDPQSADPIVGIRYDDKSCGKVKLYESVTFEVAVYNPAGGNTIVNTKANDSVVSQLLCDNNHTYSVSKQISGYSEGDTITLSAKILNKPIVSHEIPLVVSGSVIDAALKEGALYAFDFSSRSNLEADHSIRDGAFELTLNGANYTTNGFTSFLGQNCLRVAENVTGTINDSPFGSQTLESAGMAFQCQFATKNIKDAEARLLDCYDPTSGAGFYIKGNKVGIYCRNGVQQLEERSFSNNEMITLGVVVEPSNVYVERAGTKYSALRMYLNGELVAHIGYIPGRGDLFSARNITMDGSKGDLYLYYLMRYQSHYEWAQAFKNYLVKLTDTAAMIREYTAEDVLVSQTAEGSTAMRPSAAALWARGIAYCVLVADDDTFVTFDNGTSTSDNFEMTVYYYDPVRPWRSFKATKCRIRRQGTTSAKRSKKNVRIYLSKASEIIPLFPEYTNADALITYALFKLKKIRVGEKTMAVDLITIKIDYSDAGGANDCGVCDMANATYRALGNEYMTPAQRFFDGTQDIGDVHLDGLELNHSTANHPIAVFRSTSDTLQNVYFEAKGNWKEDKGEQTALGFMNTPGYNMGCYNYQDESFVEYYGLKGESLAQTEVRFRNDDSVRTDTLYLLTEYCGNRYRFLKYENGAWIVKTGSMKQINGKGSKWKVEGFVLNPVTGFELLNYQGFCWWRGVVSVDEMMKTGTGLISSWIQKLIDKGKVTPDQVPQWTYYFECMVDNDDLALAYAHGKKVPFELYRMLRYCDYCDNEKNPATFAARWRDHCYKLLNVRSLMVYYGHTDYNSLYDQQAKNMQPMFFLEDGMSVVNGVCCNNADEADDCIVDTPPSKMLPLRMYFNKVYDADGANGKDNDGGCTGDPECDPAKPTDEATGYANPYAGWNSVLWAVLRLQQEMLTDDSGAKTDLRTVIAAMRSVEANVDGVLMKPFSPDGAKYFFLEKRLKIWPKMVSSYDGIRKYVQYTATSDTIYFYALQGLGLTSLPAFIDQRWRIRDGYYQTGLFFSGYVSFRVAGPTGAKIRFRAGKTGYFGIGNDNTAAVSESVYLEAGQEYEFSKFTFTAGALVYIYQADRMSELDLSQLSLGSSDGSVDFSVMALVTALMLGSATHKSLPVGAYKDMEAANLGELPFLESLDIRNTKLKSIDCSGCPRLNHLDARDSAVEDFSVAQTSPINDIAMPSSLTDVKLLGLPELTYTGLSAASGFKVPGLSKVQRLRLESSPKLNSRRMLMDVLDGQSAAPVLNAVRICGQTLKGDASELQKLLSLGVGGITDTGVQRKPVIDADYSLTTILEAGEISNIENGIEGLTLNTVIDAFIELIDAVNADIYSGASEVDAVSLENIGDHLLYYNGESYEEYLQRIAESDQSIHDIIKQ